MSRFHDWWTGTRYPAAGVRQLPLSEVHAALLALDHPDKPWRVRVAGLGTGAQVIAEWHMREPATGTGRDRRQVERRFRFTVRLDEETREARVSAYVNQVTRQGKHLGRVVERGVGRGPRARVWSRRWHYEKDAEGRRQRVYDVDFDSNYMRDPMQKVVLASGWTWRGTRATRK